MEPISLPTFLKRNVIHAELLAAALQRARGSVLEVGIGSGAQSALLSRAVERVVSVDNDPRILAAGRENLQRFGPAAYPVAADAFSLPFPDGTFGVGVSQGLLEHFADEEIGPLLREQLRVCRSVVFSVPSDRYPRRDVGNERLMRPTRWEEIVRRAVSDLPVRIRARYLRLDLEALKYSVLARRWLGSFAVLVVIDPATDKGGRAAVAARR